MSDLTDLMKAVKNEDDLEIFLSNEGWVLVDVDEKGPGGWTAVMWAAAQEKMEALDTLVSRMEARLDLVDDFGKSALTLAAANGKARAMKYLIEKGCAVDHLDKLGKTPLMWAAESGSEECVNLLLENKASINVKDVGGESPIICAVRDGKVEMVRLMMKAGADMTSLDKMGRDIGEIASLRYLGVNDEVVSQITSFKESDDFSKDMDEKRYERRIKKKL